VLTEHLNEGRGNQKGPQQKEGKLGVANKKGTRLNPDSGSRSFTKGLKTDTENVGERGRK